MAKDAFAIRVEAHRPETHPRHQLLRALELTIATEDGVDELAATVLAHFDLCSAAALLLRCLPHVVLADLEQFVEALPETLTGLEEIVDEFPRGRLTNA